MKRFFKVVFNAPKGRVDSAIVEFYGLNAFRLAMKAEDLRFISCVEIL